MKKFIKFIAATAVTFGLAGIVALSARKKFRVATNGRDLEYDFRLDVEMQISAIYGHNNGFEIWQDNNCLANFDKLNDPAAMGLQLAPGAYHLVVHKAEYMPHWVELIFKEA